MRRNRVATSAEPVLPADLRRSAPRLVSFTVAGWAAVGVVVLLTAGSAVGGLWLAMQLTARAAMSDQLRREGVETLATVVRAKRATGEDAQTNLTYRFDHNGREYTGQGRLRKGDARRETVGVGSAVMVRYLPSRPSENWLAGNQPRNTPAAIALGMPGVAFPLAGLVLLAIRRQRRLLADGRATIARVTRVQKIGGDNGTRVYLQWELLSGASYSGHVNTTRKAPATGAFVPLLYDRDNPRRYASYPLPLLRVARW